MNPQAPLLLVRATEAYAKGGFASLVLDGKRELVQEYGPSSAYWAAQDGAVDPAVSAAVQSSLLELAQHHHALAQKGGAAAERRGRALVPRYLAGFDDTPQAPGTRLLLADLLFEGRNFRRGGRGVRAHGLRLRRARGGRRGLRGARGLGRGRDRGRARGRAELVQRAIESSLKFADVFPTHRRRRAC